MAHNVLLGHGLAVQAYRSIVPMQRLVGHLLSAHYRTQKPRILMRARKAFLDIGRAPILVNYPVE